MVGVALMVGGWFVSPVIKIVLEKAQKYLGDNYKWQTGGQKMVEELKRSLLLCQATVQGVDERAIINNSTLADLLRMLRDTVYEAEDVLDSIETKSIKDEVEGKTKNQVSKLACHSLSAVRNMVLSDKNHESLKKVVDKLKELRTDIPTILEVVKMNIKNKESQTRDYTKPRETISQPLEEVGLRGRKDELDLILDIILLGPQSNSILETNLGSQSKSSKKGEQNDNYHGIFVIPIVGMGGVGKTALAQAVYNNSEVQQTFASKAWISVSNNFDVKLVMGKIYDSFTEYPLSDLANRSLEYISVNLSQIIKGVKFLIVLDDMIESHWDNVHKILSGGAPGSVVLITTRNKVFANRVVGNTVGAIGPIALSALDSGVFWELFEHFAFGNEVMSEQKRKILKDIGKKIADKLHGLPLAAKIIGNVLNSEIDEDRWKNISQSEWWDIPEGESEILPSIGLVYEQLNPSLRQCFAYCSLFPRNSVIEKDRLVHMWIAHNFIPSDVNGVRRLEDIGRQWFDELVKKSFFQRAWDNNSYVMHELMHDLAVIVSSGECFYLGEGVAEIPKGVRHLALDTSNLEVIKRIKIPKTLRSFLYFGCGNIEGIYYGVINDMISNLDSLRVLGLSYMCMKSCSCPPRKIWNLQHLRFLDLSYTGIQYLTYDSSINLYHLQALYIRKCNIKELPKGINKLINLRHFCAEEETIAQISGIGQLTNLQELSVFVVGQKEGNRIRDLRDLRDIRGSLKIKNFENIKNKDEAMQAKLADNKHLDGIHIIANHTGKNSNEDMEILQELQPNKDIKDLRIERYGGLDFPNWIIQIGNRFPNLNTLCLVSCVNVKVLPPLGELPSLKHLQIIKFDSVKLIDSHLYGKNPTVFPLLEVLVLDGLSNCEEWTSLREGVREFFPCLSKLTIENSALREAPLNLFSSTLKNLKIRKCRISVGNSIPSLSSITQLELYSFSAIISLDPLNMPFLEDLNLEDCPGLKIEGGLQSLTHLKCLRLVNCRKPFRQYSRKDQQKGKGLQVNQDAGLRSLTLREAPRNLFSSTLKKLKIRKCEISDLNSIPSLSSITQLELHSFSASISLDPLNMPFLEDLNLKDCPELKIEGDLQSLTHLKFLKLVHCSKLFIQYSTKDQQKGKDLQVNQDAGLRALTHIEADYSLVKREYHLILGSLPSLQILKFSWITQFTNNQNLWFEKLTALKEITFSKCQFEHLPASLTQLSSLKKMALHKCSRLESLTDSMPPNLQELHLTDCSRNLVQLCKAYEGQDRQFISSILVIHIDDYTNRKVAVVTDASEMKSMELRKPQISDAIGLQACASCSKIFELSDLVLRSWTETRRR